MSDEATRACEMANAAAYGEQCADTDGSATERVFWLGRPDGHEHPQAAMARMLTGSTAADPFPQFLQLHATIDKLEARIARKEAANEALVAKLEATLADMQSLQRKAADWEAECRRLSALLIEAQQQLAQRMAMPANALKHTKGLR